jgi:chloramphenicol 3-O-phosphotransferase
MTRTSQPGDPHRQVDYDLELNTGRFTPHEAAEVILLAATKHFMRLVD